jgi:transketolase
MTAKDLPMDTMGRRFVSISSDLLDAHPRLAVVLAGIAGERFASAARRHQGRVIDVGAREQLQIGVGGGLALAGMRPIMHASAGSLVERRFERIRVDLGREGVGGVVVGESYGRPADVALLDTLDGWTVHVPGHPDEAEVLLRRAAAEDGRVYVRLSPRSNLRPRPVAESRFLTMRGGRGGVVIAVGPMLDEVMAATEGLNTTVLYAATVRPFDGRAVREAVAGRDAADVMIVEPYLAGTSTRFADEALAGTPHRVLGLGVARRAPRGCAEQLAADGLDARSLRARILAFLPR